MSWKETWLMFELKFFIVNLLAKRELSLAKSDLRQIKTLIVSQCCALVCNSVWEGIKI